MISGFEQIKKYIPQREPMMMVDHLVSHEEKKTVSGFEILADNPLVDGTVLSEAGLLENMAQTAALSKGYEVSLKNEQAPLGFIGAVKNFKVRYLPKVGQFLRTQIRIKHEVLNASIVDAEISCGNKQVASCELKIFLNPQISSS